MKSRDEDICAFIGINGTGKSTSLKASVGIHSVDHGQKVLNNINLLEKPQDYKINLGYAPDNSNLYENLRIVKYLNFIGSMYKVPLVLFKKCV